MNEEMRADKLNSMIVSNRYINTRSPEIETRTVVARVTAGRVRINPIVFVNRSPNNISRTTKQLACGGDIMFVAKINKRSKATVFEVYDVLHGSPTNGKMPTNKMESTISARLLQDLLKDHSDVYKWLDSSLYGFYIPRFKDDTTYDGDICETDISRMMTVEKCVGTSILSTMSKINKGSNQAAWLYTAALFSNGNDIKEMKGFKRSLTPGFALNIGVGKFCVNDKEVNTSLCVVFNVVKAFSMPMRKERAKFVGVKVVAPNLKFCGESVAQYFGGLPSRLSLFKDSIQEFDEQYYKDNAYDIFGSKFDYLDFTRVVVCLPLEGIKQLFNGKVTMDNDQEYNAIANDTSEKSLFKLIERYTTMPQCKRPYLAVDGWTTRVS